jgi:hypothetical protein
MGVTSISGPGHLGRPQTLWPQEGLSLHRSEGFGRGMAEALQLGVDVIATAYGGNTVFCTGPLAHPVRRWPRVGGARSGACR